MNTEFGKQVSKHLEFLGYTVDDITDKKDKKFDFFIANHDNKANLDVKAYEYIAFFNVRFFNFSNKLLKDISFLNLLNDCNNDAIITTWSLEDDAKNKSKILKISSSLMNYDKKSFGVFLDHLCGDISSFGQKFVKYTT